MIISDTTVSTSASQFKIDYKYYNVASIISSIVERVVNSNWEILKAMVDPHINRFVAVALQKSALQPIFNKISVQEFCNAMFYI